MSNSGGYRLFAKGPGYATRLVQLTWAADGDIGFSGWTADSNLSVRESLDLAGRGIPRSLPQTRSIDCPTVSPSSLSRCLLSRRQQHVFRRCEAPAFHLPVRGW